MSEQIGNDNDGILLLELGIDTDQTEFDKARKSLEDLRNSMQDLSLNVDLGTLLDGLRKAANLLKGLINGWNSLEDKAITVAYTVNNNVPYNISEATRRNIEYGVSSSTVAQKSGLESSDILGSLSSIQELKSQTENLGVDPKDTDWIAVNMLGRIMGDPKFQGDNLKNTLLNSTQEETYLALTNLLANAYRQLEAYPDNSPQRDVMLEAITNVIKTPYISPDEANYIALMTKKENPTYGASGNPMRQFVSGGLEDTSSPMENLTALTNENIDIANDLGTLASRRQKAKDWLTSSTYNFLGQAIVKPFVAEPITTIADWLNPEKMSKLYPLENYSGIFGAYEHYRDVSWSTAKSMIGMDYEEQYANLAAKFGLTAGWVEQEGAIEDKKLAMISRIANSKGDAIANELGYYELMRMLQPTYRQDARALTTGTLGMLQSLPEFKGKSAEDVQKAMLDPNSAYYIGEGAFSDIYTMLYRTGAYNKDADKNAKEYLQTMASVFNNVKMSELSQFFPGLEDSGTDITKAKVKDVQSGWGKDWRLILTIQQSDGSTREYALTADQLASGMKVPGM